MFLLICTIITIIYQCEYTAGVKDIGYFWHVTDFHYDFSYWSDQLSCTKEVTSPGIYGDYRCDSPWLLVKDSISFMKSSQSSVDFILWTGDNIAHIDNKDLTNFKNFETLQNITNELKGNFPQIPVYATLGNHDYLPHDQFPGKTNIIYRSVGEMWKDWIGDDIQLNNFKNGGYYSIKDSHGLRILALNTNMYATADKVTSRMADPAGQLDWLDKQLTTAYNNKEKVLITAHIPIGIHTPEKTLWFYKKFNDKFLHIIDKHVDNDFIVGMYYGHEHADGFKVYYNSKGKAAFPVFIAPSITPWTYDYPHNPAVRLVSYNRVTGQPRNIKTYYVNLPDSNSNNRTDWKIEYDFKTAYNVNDVTATSLHDLTQSMETDRSLVDLYYKFKHVNATGALACDDGCQESVLCGFRYFTTEKYNYCLNSSTVCSLSSSVVVAFIIISLLM